MNPLLVITGCIGASIYLFAAFLTCKMVAAKEGSWIKPTPKIITLYIIGALLVFTAILPMIYSVQGWP